jgi:hypothetical protein
MLLLGNLCLVSYLFFTNCLASSLVPMVIFDSGHMNSYISMNSYVFIDMRTLVPMVIFDNNNMNSHINMNSNFRLDIGT